VLSWFMALGLATGAPGPAVSACTALADDAQRLACYDNLFRPTPEAAGEGMATAVASSTVAAGAASAVPTEAPTAATPAGSGTAMTAAAVAAPDAVEEFGLTLEQKEAKKPNPKPPTDAIEARVVSVKRQSPDRYTIVLENEQVWTQVEASLRQPFFAGDTVRIRKAALGSFVATGPSSGGAVRVRRVK
jgi:hypothetical protein